jgi:5-methylcytosine-specific restriction endonuclease McrA
MTEDPDKRRAYNQAYRAANRDKILAQKRSYRAAHLEEEKQRRHAYWLAHCDEIQQKQKAFYYKHRARLNAESAKRRKAKLADRRQKDKEYYQQNKDIIKKRKALYRKTNAALVQAKNARYRANKAKAPRNDLTKEQWQAIKKHYGYRCVYCRRKMQRLTQDHITPLSNGGSHTLHNVVPACQACNSRKKNGQVLCPIQPLLIC